jgi:hypothetical protein
MIEVRKLTGIVGILLSAMMISKLEEDRPDPDGVGIARLRIDDVLS